LSQGYILITYSPFTCGAIYRSRLFWCEFQSVGDISCRDVCLLTSIIELDGTQLVVLKAPEKYIWKSQQQCLSPEIMTLLLKIIHRPCCQLPVISPCRRRCVSTHGWEACACNSTRCKHYWYPPRLSYNISKLSGAKWASSRGMLPSAWWYSWKMCFERKKIVPTWHARKVCGLSWVTGWLFLEKVIAVESFKCIYLFILDVWAPQVKCHLVPISQRHTPKQSRSMNSTTGKRRVSN